MNTQIAVMPVPDLMELIKQERAESYAAGYIQAKRELEKKDDPEELIKVSEAAELCNISYSTIIRRIDAKRIPFETHPDDGRCIAIKRKYLPEVRKR